MPPSHSQISCVLVAGSGYGNCLVQMDLVSSTLTQAQCFSDISLGNVYLGRDIWTGGEVAVKIACLSDSMLGHEYRVYMTIAGSIGTPRLIWYGKEDMYKVIVLEYLGNSIGDLVNKEKFDSFANRC